MSSVQFLKVLQLAFKKKKEKEKEKERLSFKSETKPDQFNLAIGFDSTRRSSTIRKRGKLSGQVFSPKPPTHSRTHLPHCTGICLIGTTATDALKEFFLEKITLLAYINDCLS